MNFDQNVRYEEAKRRRIQQLDKGIAPLAKTTGEMLMKMGIRATDSDANVIAHRALNIALKRDPKADRATRVAVKKQRKAVAKKLAKNDVKAGKSRARKAVVA